MSPVLSLLLFVLLGPVPAAAAAEAEAVQFEQIYLSPIADFFAAVQGPDGSPASAIQRVGARPQPALRDGKSARTLRIFVVGGSVAQVFDERELERSLRSVLPGYAFEIVDCGVSSYDSYRDLLTVKEVLSHHPDLIIVMSGVNEAGHPGLDSMRSPRRALRVLGKGLLAGRPLRALRLILPDLKAPRGPERIAADFEASLRAMARAAKERKVPMLFCTLPWNMRDMPPRGSLPLQDPAFFKAWRHFERREFRKAAAGFRGCLGAPAGTDGSERRRREAFAHYYLARSLDALGIPAAARSHYLAALDSQTPPMPRLNRLIRRVSGEEGAALADLERAFSEASPKGLVGFTLFEDDMHWDRAADPLVAAVITDAAAGASRWNAGRSLAPVEAWDAGKLKEQVPDKWRLREADPKQRAWTVFTIRAWDSQLAREARLSERVVALMREVYRCEPGLLKDPAGMKRWLKEKLAGNVWSADAAATLDEWWPAMLGHIGEMLLREGKPQESLALFDQALALDPQRSFLRLRRAVALAAMGKRDEAREALELLRPETPKFPELESYLAEFTGNQGTAPGHSRQ
ncbi:MAG: hypothetical protein A2X36_10805 [Elusimicrobia bacterium GWA2_69_24]|nr:MAG: hypothetical protein A2X36_10805 [Elusimicrobia bacterium GWA2_69_24]HBL18477.1 hypothetical protein [Elusimicrobiota bacterium]